MRRVQFALRFGEVWEEKAVLSFFFLHFILVLMVTFFEETFQSLLELSKGGSWPLNVNITCKPIRNADLQTYLLSLS